MRRLPITLALAAAAIAVSLPLLAADPLPWPWKAKTPPDPALVELSHVDDLSVVIDKSNSILTITVKAQAPSSDYSELQLTYRLGDPKDRIFSFDARGRAPQDTAAAVLTPVTIESSYSDAPIGKFDVIEVFSNDNCLAYSVTDSKSVPCTGQVSPR